MFANLKAKKLVGFKSHGMVLCAVNQNEDGSETVEFVEPPADAAVGEKITYEGLTGEPASTSQVHTR